MLGEFLDVKYIYMQKMIFPTILLTNFWIWKIFSTNFFIGVVCILATLTLYSLLQSNKENYKPFVFLLILLLFLQYTTTTKISLTELTPDEKRVQQTRLDSYSPVSFKFMDKIVYIPVAHALEGRKESIAISRIENNFAQAIDPALYFFANHPRERIGIREFEKYPYLLFPAFIIGLIILKSRFKLLICLLIPPILILSLIGHNNSLGPFSLFPFITIVTTFGTIYLYERFKQNKLLVKGFILIYILVLIQIWSYAKN